MPRIIATIKDDGTVTFKVEDIAGPGCTKLTSALQRAVGTTTKDVRTNDDFATGEVEQERKTVRE